MVLRLNRTTVQWCVLNLGKPETRLLIRMAFQTERFRMKWLRKWKELIERINNITISSLLHTDAVPDSGTIQSMIIDFLNEHAKESIEKGLKDTYNPIKSETKLAKFDVRRSLWDLQRRWDKVRARKIFKRNEVMAKKIKDQYLKKCQSVWDRKSRDFRAGNEFDQQEAKRIITEASGGVRSRGNMIVETETTRYYNQARKSYFDSSPDVGYYLFLAIMDQATTKWCSTRHKIIYEKDDPVTKRETPPIHWNCRSEMVPLTPLNPVHKKLIDNKSMWRENSRRKFEPLPKGWNE
jgi:SPP1 gp7 family putative phage head morphogenesis protein